MDTKHRPTPYVIALAALLLGGCSVVELGGKVARRTGEALTDYSKENDGLIAKAAGVGGGVYTAVGGTVEESARKSKEENSTNPLPSPSPNAQQQSGTQVRMLPSASPEQLMSIADIQKRLAELGFQPGPADGTMGKRTVDALAKFQQKSKLPVTGKADPATIEALRSAK